MTATERAAEVIAQAFHEIYCHVCGRPNLHSWAALPSTIWREVFGSEDVQIRCPQCFAAAYEAKFGEVTWALTVLTESDEARDARFTAENDRIWGAGEWVRCAVCPPDSEGRQVYHHRLAHARPA